MYCTSKNCVGRARDGPGRHDQLMPEKQIVGQGSELVPGGMISSDHARQKFMKILERPELVPGRGISSEQPQQKRMKNWPCSEVVLNLGGVRAGPRGWDELGPAKLRRL